MDDDSHVIDKGWDALPDYATSGDADDAVTVSISTTPGEWLVNTSESVVVPMSMAEVVDALRHRKLNERSLVWRAGMQEWAAIDKVPQLKLAARLPPTAEASPAAANPAPSAPPPSAAQHGRPPSKTPPPRSPQPQQLSRRSTLPFGLPAPSHTARPSQPRLASPISAPPPPSEEQVLAVYTRPAATISFDLSPSEPVRIPAPASAPALPGPPPQTLAPTTTEAHRPERWQPPSSPADLSVVAASQFRAVQRSSKRLLWLTSLGSAAAASVLTLWVSGAMPWARVDASAVASAPPAGAAVAARLQAPAATPVVTPPPSSPSAAPPPAVSATPVAEAAPALPSEPAKPKPIAVAAKPAAPKPAAPKPAAPKPKAVTVAQAAPRSATEPTGAEPNPYDVKLDDEAAQASQPAAQPATRGLLELMQESERKAAEPKAPEVSGATDSSSSGF